MPPTPHQRAEAQLTEYGLSFPETTSGPAWLPARGLYVRKKMFAVFGAKGEPLDADGRRVAVRAAGAWLV
jgi:hypothetical protein